MTYPSNDNEIESLDTEETEFKITREEVEYLVNNIQNEYLSRDTYYVAINLIKKMRVFLGESHA